jgi:anti-sigma B factor antagonist
MMCHYTGSILGIGTRGDKDMSCSVTTRKLYNVMIVELAGKFTTADASGVIWGVVSDLLRNGHRHILLELSKVSYLDSAAGIGELVRSYTTALRQDAQVKLLRVGKNVERVLAIVGLNKVFEIFDDETAAVRSFEKSKETAAADKA